MELFMVMLKYLATSESTKVSEALEYTLLSDADAEFIEALAVSLLIVCIYLLYWIKNKGQY